MNKDNPLTDDDYLWPYFALGYMAGAWSKEQPHPGSHILERTMEIKEKLEAMQERKDSNGTSKINE